MATRPVFKVEAEGEHLVRVRSVDFKWYSGMALSRKQLSIRSLQKETLRIYPNEQVLEVSRMSENPTGQRLSAFNLCYNYGGRMIPVECIFQSSKVFEHGGPFLDILETSPFDAKRDERLRSSGRLMGFSFGGYLWPLEPQTAFYDWVYINALHNNSELSEAVCNFSIFSDIAFNPEKSINCQADAAALYVSLAHRGLIRHALSSRQAFLKMEAKARVFDYGSGEQGSLF